MARLSDSVAPLVKTISLRIGADQPGDLSAGIFDRFLGLPAEFVIAAGGVAEFLGEIGQHGLEHARINRRRGLIVHVDREA